MNRDIKEKMKDAHLYIWQVAKILGVCETTLIRWLRDELPQEKREMILAAIEKGGQTNEHL